MPNKKKTLSREFCMKYIFHYLSLRQLSNLADQEIDESTLSEDFRRSYTEPDDEHPDNTLDNETYAGGNTLALGVIKEKDSLIEKIGPLLKRSKFSDLEVIVQSVLLTSAFEILHTKTPYQVVINEGVNVANKYAKSESLGLINGVLDALAKK